MGFTWNLWPSAKSATAVSLPAEPPTSETSHMLLERASDRRWLNATTIGYGLVGLWAILGGLVTAWNPALVDRLERQTQIAFREGYGPVAPPDNIVILAIDADSLAQGEYYSKEPDRYPEMSPLESWPWQRTAYARAVDRLLGAGAKVVAIDLILASPSTYGKADDQAFQQVLQRYAGQVVLAAVHSATEMPDGFLDRLELPTPGLETKPEVLGFLNFLRETDGKIHRLPSRYAEEVIKPAGIAQGSRFPNGLSSLSEATLAAAKIPVPPPKGDHIFIYGPRNTFPTLPFWHVLDSNRWQIDLQNGDYFKDKIVLIGPTAEDFQDFQRTAFASGNGMPGVEVHANVIASLMEGRTIAEALPNLPLRGLAVTLGMMAAIVLLWRLPQHLLTPLVWGLGLALVWSGVSFTSYNTAGVILPTAVPVLTLVLAGASHTTVRAVGAQLEKLHLRRTLERYVSRAIVDEILNQPEDYRALMLGRKIKAAVMFCDIRSFTTLSVRLSPEELVAQLNTYLSAMVDEIIRQRGTIDKYIGDAIMAEFGSPVSQGEKADALNAVRAALGMRSALAQLRLKWQAEGKVPLFNGIGISYGEVIAGNIGSVVRSEYTVIGDTVNVASRVEGLTKNLGTDLLITDTLYELVKDQITAIDLGAHHLRGRDSTVQLYSVVGFKGDDPTLYEQVHAGLKAFQAQIKLEAEHAGTDKPAESFRGKFG